MKPRLVIALRAAHLRLALIDTLRDRFTIHPVSEIEEAVRLVRQHRPQVVLLGVSLRWMEGVRVARQIKTEAGEPPGVGLLDPRGRIQQPAEVVVDCMADGVFQAALDPGAVERFIDQMERSPPALVGRSASGLRRWLP